MGRPCVWHFILIWFLDYFNIFALCEQFWKHWIWVPFYVVWVPFWSHFCSKVGPLWVPFWLWNSAPNSKRQNTNDIVCFNLDRPCLHWFWRHQSGATLPLKGPLSSLFPRLLPPIPPHNIWSPGPRMSSSCSHHRFGWPPGPGRSVGDFWVHHS